MSRASFSVCAHLEQRPLRCGSYHFEAKEPSIQVLEMLEGTLLVASVHMCAAQLLRIWQSACRWLQAA